MSSYKKGRIGSPFALVENSINDARTILKTGRLGKDNYDEPRVRLTGGLAMYTNAVGHFSQIGAPGGNASPKDKAAYNKVKGTLDNLKEEIRGYAKRLMENTTRQAEGYASSLTKQVDAERKGRKLLGVPIAPRPSSSLVARALSGAKVSVNSSKGYVNSVYTVLNNANVAETADTDYHNSVADRFDSVEKSLDALESRHGENITTVAQSKADRQAEKERKREERAAKDIDKQWEKEQKRHLDTIKKKKWF